MRNVPIIQIAKYLNIACIESVQVSGYQIDSKMVGEGDLFFALKGKKADGHQFLEEVRARGAVGAVVSKEYVGPDFGLILLRVDDVVQSLQDLARHFMRDSKPVVVGITGSLGKTTTKEFTATLLEGKFKVGKTHLNYNTKLTYPITLLNRSGDEDVLVVELGMTEPGDIARLVEIAAPDIAVITKIAYVHGAYFERGVVDIAKYKADIFSKAKKCIFDHALYQYEEAIEKIRGERVSFSLTEPSSDYSLENISCECPYKQSHILHNFLAAVTVAREMGMDWHEIQARTSFLKLPKMRFEEIVKDGVILINDAYNANAESMKAALSHMPEPKVGGRRIAVLGMMVDMGKEHERLHKEVGRFASEHIDHLLVFGNEAAPIYEEFVGVKELYSDFHSLSCRLKALVRAGDVVLLKASRSVGMEKLFEMLC